MKTKIDRILRSDRQLPAIVEALELVLPSRDVKTRAYVNRVELRRASIHLLLGLLALPLHFHVFTEFYRFSLDASALFVSPISFTIPTGLGWLYPVLNWLMKSSSPFPRDCVGNSNCRSRRW